MMYMNAGPNRGHIEVICGPMFSGKSEELISRLNRVRIARQRCQIFKPRLDDRYDKNKIVTHSAQRLEAVVVGSSQELLENVDWKAAVIAIDEVQFFDEGIVEVCEKLANSGKRVVVAGLDLDFLGHPFGPVPRLLAVAEYVTKQLAVCMKCGSLASRSQRLAPHTETVLVGSKDLYEARCRHCWDPTETLDAAQPPLFPRPEKAPPAPRKPRKPAK
jgi:thymidine kinase